MRLLILLLSANFCFGQTVDDNIIEVKKKISEIKLEEARLEKELENFKLEKVINDLKEVGLPSDDYIEHSAMILEYAERHEQAKWVAHIILPEIKNGKQPRTDDFRVDPKVKTGTAVEADYFLTTESTDGETEYDGFGWDRGHLAPSSDFKWSRKALSESYYYSNMSPQVPELNRRRWADLESHLRNYVIENNVPLYVVTAPVLNYRLPKIERAINKVSIPEKFTKVAYDPVNQRMIGFLIPNQNATFELEEYAKSVDEIEEIVGFNFFKNVDQTLEAEFDKDAWFSNLLEGDVAAMDQNKLPRYHYNSTEAAKMVNQDVTVCGKVVSSRYSRKGNLWLNVDKQWPNNVFSIFIPKEKIASFSYDPKVNLESKIVCFKGKVEQWNSSPTIKVISENQIFLYEEEIEE